MVIGSDFRGHGGKRTKEDEELMGRYGVQERDAEGQMIIDFAKRMDIAMVNTHFMRGEENRVMNKIGGRC